MLDKEKEGKIPEKKEEKAATEKGRKAGQRKIVKITEKKEEKATK